MVAVIATPSDRDPPSTAPANHRLAMLNLQVTIGVNTRPRQLFPGHDSARDVLTMLDTLHAWIDARMEDTTDEW
jgi:hypothetical protein